MVIELYLFLLSKDFILFKDYRNLSCSQRFLVGIDCHQDSNPFCSEFKPPGLMNNQRCYSWSDSLKLSLNASTRYLYKTWAHCFYRLNNLCLKELQEAY